jgi:hypothetical protein
VEPVGVHRLVCALQQGLDIVMVVGDHRSDALTVSRGSKPSAALCRFCGSRLKSRPAISATTANSSPQRRPTVSSLRTHSRKRRDTHCRAASASVPVGVVGRLEIVQVDHRCNHPSPAATAAGERLCQTVVEDHAVDRPVSGSSVAAFPSWSRPHQLEAPDV